MTQSQPPFALRYRRARTSAIALAMLTLTAGCAVQPPRPAAWRLEPTVSVTHSQASSTAYYQMGHYEAGLQRWDRAADAYRKAIAADPRNVEAYNALGVVLAQAKRYGEAEAVLRNAAALDPKRAHVLSNLGNVLLLAGRPHDAVPELQTAVQLDASDRIAIDNLRQALALSRPMDKTAPAEPEAPAATAPAVADLPVAALPTSLPSYRIQIVNGNGIAGVAARMRAWLLERGVVGAHLGNLPPFRSATTRIEYQPGYAEQAREVSRRMPTHSELVSVPASRASAEVRVIIGHDIKSAAACAALGACRGATTMAAAASTKPSPSGE